MNNNKNIPQLRFPEFVGDWEKLIIKDIANKITDGTHDTPKPTETGIPFLTAIHVRDGFIDFENCYYLPEDVHQKIYARCNPEKDDLLMVNIGAGVATSAKVDVEFEFSLKNVALIKPNQTKIEPDFFSQIQRRNSERLRHQISAGGAQPFLSLKEIGKLKLIIPKKIPEQTHIATFLTAVDKRINLLQKKKAELEQYKKGVMQKLFSQELRFKKDDGSDFPDWEEKKLGEVAEIKRGASPRPISSLKWFDEKSKIGWVRISDVSKSNKFLNETQQYLSEEGVKKSRLVQKGNMIMSICATIGKPIYTNFETCIHDGFVVFENPKIEKEYLYYFLEKIQKKWYQYGQPGTQVNLNSDIVSNEKIPYPHKDEQQKIANFLSSIDKSIKKLGNQIDDSVVFKQGLLQKMFV